MDLLRKSGLDLKRRDTLLHPAESIEIGDDEFDIDEVLARAKIANRKLATLQIERKSADVDVQVADDLTKPQVDLTRHRRADRHRRHRRRFARRHRQPRRLSVPASACTLSFEMSGAAKKGRDAAVAKKPPPRDRPRSTPSVRSRPRPCSRSSRSPRRASASSSSKKAERVAERERALGARRSSRQAARRTTTCCSARAKRINARLAIGRAPCRLPHRRRAAAVPERHVARSVRHRCEAACASLSDRIPGLTICGPHPRRQRRNYSNYRSKPHWHDVC